MTTVCSAGAAEAQTNDLALIPEDLSLWKESLLWDRDVVIRAGVGYKDNVLLSPSARQGSGFVTSGLDLSLIRLPLDGWEFNLAMIGDDVRYFRNPGGLKGEDLFMGSAQVQRYFDQVWRGGLELRYSYVDQVLQELIFTGGVRAVEAKGQTLGVRPFIRRDLSTNWWVQIEAPLGREWWQAPLDATWKLGGQAVLGYNYGSHSQISISGGAFDIPHDEWLARNSAGDELPGSHLELRREVAELKWEQQWDGKNRWSTTTRFGFNHSQDNGGGFYDFYRYFLSAELHYHTPAWNIKANAGWSYYDFPVQTISVPPAPLLHLGTFAAGLRVERRIFKALRGFAAFEFEQTTSNDPSSAYHYKLASSGLSWEF